jgi:hypothetical protein
MPATAATGAATAGGSGAVAAGGGGGVAAGTDTGGVSATGDAGEGGVGTRGAGAGGVATTAASGAFGVGLNGGSEAPSRAFDAGVATRGIDGGVARGLEIGVARGLAGGVCVFGRPATNGPGCSGACLENASCIASTEACGRAGVIVIPMGITPPQVEQRARTPPCGTFAGSTLYTVEHCGQLTFIPGLHSRLCVPRRLRKPAGDRPCACQSNTPSR